MSYIQYLYYGALILSMIYFILYIISVIRNFSNILGVKVFSINPPPEKDIEVPLEDSNKTASLEASNPNRESKLKSDENKSHNKVLKPL